MTVLRAFTAKLVGRNSGGTGSGDEQGSIFRLQLYAVLIAINAGAGQTPFPAAIFHNRARGAGLSRKPMEYLDYQSKVPTGWNVSASA